MATDQKKYGNRRGSFWNRNKEKRIGLARENDLHKKLDTVLEKQEIAHKKPHWLIQLGKDILTKPVLFILGPALGVVIGVYSSEKNTDSILLNQFNIEHSQGPCIHGGRSSTAYTELGNIFANSLSSIGYVRYGFCDPSPGSETNLKRLSPELDDEVVSNEKGFAISQYDVIETLRQENKIPYIQEIFALKSIPECALIPANDRFQSFKDLITESQNLTQRKEAGEIIEPLKIALVREGSGSFITGNNIIAATLNTDVVEVILYNNPSDIVAAVNAGNADVGLFVEYPGRVQGQLHNGLKDVIDQDMNLLNVSEETFSNSFSETSYKLQQVTIAQEFSLNPYSVFQKVVNTPISRNIGQYFHEPEEVLPQMICTHPIIAARTLESIENSALRGDYIQTLLEDVTANIREEGLSIQGSITVRTLAP